MNTVIWTKNDCKYCSLAKQQLYIRNIEFEERNLSKGNWSKEQLLKEVPGAKTVPQIFIRGNYIGGYSDLLQYIEDHNMNING